MIDAVVFAVLSLAVGLVSIYARPAWLRAAAYAGLVVGILLLWYAALGQPRPQYLHIPSGTVLGYHLDEPNAIYLWLMPNGSAQPLALQLPWYDDVASNLLDAARHRNNPGDSLKMKSGVNGLGLHVKPIFYVSHAESLPAKTPPR